MEPVQCQLRFSQGLSQSQGMPSQNLSNPFQGLCLNSQPRPSQPASGERRPVPLFCEGPASGGGSSQQQPLGLGSQEMLGTQDFITPVDNQFGLEYEPGARDMQRSPARLSPNRVKRPRKDDEAENDERAGRPEARGGGGAAGPSGRCSSCGQVVPAARGAGAAANLQPRRARSPPCYRNKFSEEDEADAGFPDWNAPRGGVAESRYKNDFREIGLLGHGNYSRVYRVRHRLNGHEYAVKRSTRELQPEDPAFQQFIQEAQVLAHIPPHPHIVGYYTSWTERAAEGGEYLFHQLEKCDVSVGSLISLREPLREADVLELLRQMCLALRHLHSLGVAHLDVKPDNIYTLGGEDSGREGPRQYKLGDFGQAARLSRRGGWAVNEGDSRYLPLEVMNGDHSRLDKADMFALGMTLYELATRTEPPSGGQLYQDLRHGKVPLLVAASASLAKLIKSLLRLNPDDRPSADRVLASSLLAKKAGSPSQQQPQGSTASAQSAQTADGRLGGLVLQRSVHC